MSERERERARERERERERESERAGGRERYGKPLRSQTKESEKAEMESILDKTKNQQDRDGERFLRRKGRKLLYDTINRSMSRRHTEIDVENERDRKQQSSIETWRFERN